MPGGQKFPGTATMNVFKSLSILFLASLLAIHTSAQKRLLLIGTYTDKGTSEGIYVYEFDSRTGKAVYKSKAVTDNPSYLTVSHDRNFVYAVNEKDEGSVTAFNFNKRTGNLKQLNSQPSHGAAPCYIATDKAGKYLFVANYTSGSFAVFPILRGGLIGNAVQVIQHRGGSINKERQEGPHDHSTVLSPEHKYVMVSNLGTDKIYIYNFNPQNKLAPLSEAKTPSVSVPEGSGPRHLDFHPNGRFAYSIQELSGNVTAFSYHEGILTPIQNISMVAGDFKGVTGAADVHVSPDGNFLYTSNRGDANDIAVFSIDKNTGELTLKGRVSTMGKGPRNFVIDPSGNFLLAGNQYTDSVIIFKRNKTTGMLTDTGERIKVGSPVCLKF